MTSNDQMSGELEKRLAWAREWMANASEEEKEAMYKAQRESWSKGPHGPTDGMGTVYYPASRTPSHGRVSDIMAERMIEAQAIADCMSHRDDCTASADHPGVCGCGLDQLRRALIIRSTPPQPEGGTVEKIAAILLGNVNAPEQVIYRVAREIAALQPEKAK